MDEKEFRELAPGDWVKHRGNGISYMVTDNFGGRVTAIRTADLTNVLEWDVVVKVSRTRVDKQGEG